MEKRKYLPGIILIGALWLALTLAAWFGAPNEESDSERRKLAQMPEIKTESILNGSFMTDFESYTLDQFPLRDSFRTLKSMAVFYGLGQKDNNDIYIADGYAAKLEYPLNEKSIVECADKFTWLYENYIKDKTDKVYLSVVPDKGYYLAEANGYPAMDYEKLFSVLGENMPYAEYIDITGALDIKDYYKTDTHWKQENLVPAVKLFAEKMDFEFTDDFKVNTADSPFYGVYYGQAALPMPAEKISWLTNDVIDSAIVTNLETGTVGGVYDLAELEGRDPYEIYLYGASPIVEIENPNAKEEKKLVIFRDSFGSSITPLMIEGYSKITLVDIRYILSSFVGNYIDCTDADVLFLYSTLVLNSSNTLK
ncbi:MAG: hypothetical protein IJC50_00750 [Clostridia bacterium]|nr:hypothetical protein [Clostridia bacterium]